MLSLNPKERKMFKVLNGVNKIRHTPKYANNEIYSLARDPNRIKETKNHLFSPKYTPRGLKLTLRGQKSTPRGLITIPKIPSSTAKHLKSTPRSIKFDYQCLSPPSTDQKSIYRGHKLTLRFRWSPKFDSKMPALNSQGHEIESYSTKSTSRPPKSAPSGQKVTPLDSKLTHPKTKLQRPRIAIRGLNRLSEVYTLLLDAKTQPLKAQNKLTEPKIDSQKPKVDSKRV